jgi:hypothetical protein
MVQLKMRPIFSRGNSVASISVAAPNKPDDDADDENEQQQHGDASTEREALGRNVSPQQQRRMQLRRRRRRLVHAHVAFSDTVTEHPAGEPLTEWELKAYFYSVRPLLIPGLFRIPRAGWLLARSRRAKFIVPW